MINKAQQFWDNQASKFEESEKHFKEASAEIIARTREYLDENDSVLDFGCATGTYALELAGAVKNIHGLDFSAEMISEANKKLNKLNVKNVSFSQGMIFDNELEKASFDKIVAFAIIHLMEDSEKVIQRIHDLLHPGGLFISTTACFKDKMDFKTRLTFTKYRILIPFGLFPLHLNMYKSSDVEQLIKNQNFDIIKAEKLFFNQMTINFIAAKKY